MKQKIAASALLGTLVFGSASMAQEAPSFFKDTVPEHALGAVLGGYGTFQGDSATLDPKYRELIALAVAAQIPCQYCVYAHRNSAMDLGATDAEMREAVTMGAYVRFWSTVLQGADYDLDKFKGEHDALRAAR